MATLIVSGWASTSKVDDAGHLVKSHALQLSATTFPVLAYRHELAQSNDPNVLKYRTAGDIRCLEYRKAENGEDYLWCDATISDPEVIKDIENQYLKGFSAAFTPDEFEITSGPNSIAVISKAILTEVSLVRYPANSSCKFQSFKKIEDDPHLKEMQRLSGLQHDLLKQGIGAVQRHINAIRESLK